MGTKRLRPTRHTQIGQGRPQWARTVIAILTEQGRSQVWLADQVDSSQAHLSKALAHTKTIPDKARQIAEALGSPYGVIFPTPCFWCGKTVYLGEPCDCKKGAR